MDIFKFFFIMSNLTYIREGLPDALMSKSPLTLAWKPIDKGRNTRVDPILVTLGQTLAQNTPLSLKSMRYCSSLKKPKKDPLSSYTFLHVLTQMLTKEELPPFNNLGNNLYKDVGKQTMLKQLLETSLGFVVLKK